MANTNAPFGFSHSGGNGSAPTMGNIAVQIAYNAGAIYFGDPVSPTAAGGVAQAAPSDTTIAGIFIGCKYLSIASKRVVWSRYWPGSDVASGNIVEGYIINDPNARFLVQCDGTGLTQAAVNANISFAIGTGNTQTGNSGAYLDTSTLGITATLPFRVISLYDFPPGAPGTIANGATYNWAYVGFNSVATKSLTGV